MAMLHTVTERSMEIQYQHTVADSKAYYEDLWTPRKVARRREFYASFCWYLAVIGMAGYLALKHEEVYFTCVFLVLAFDYVRRNWTFDRQWRAAVDTYAALYPEGSCVLHLDEHGLRECFSGVQIHVSWSEIQDYKTYDGRLLIHFLNFRAFIIPLHCLSIAQHEDLLAMLERHGVPCKS